MCPAAGSSDTPGATSHGSVDAVHEIAVPQHVQPLCPRSQPRVERDEFAGGNEVTGIREVRCLVVGPYGPTDAIEVREHDGVDVVGREIGGVQLVTDARPALRCVGLGALRIERQPRVDDDATATGADPEAADLELQHHSRIGDLEREVGYPDDRHEASLAPRSNSSYPNSGGE